MCVFVARSGYDGERSGAAHCSSSFRAPLIYGRRRRVVFIDTRGTQRQSARKVARMWCARTGPAMVRPQFQYPPLARTRTRIERMGPGSARARASQVIHCTSSSRSRAVSGRAQMFAARLQTGEFRARVNDIPLPSAPKIVRFADASERTVSAECIGGQVVRAAASTSASGELIAHAREDARATNGERAIGARLLAA